MLAYRIRAASNCQPCLPSPCAPSAGMCIPHPLDLYSANDPCWPSLFICPHEVVSVMRHVPSPAVWKPVALIDLISFDYGIASADESF